MIYKNKITHEKEIKIFYRQNGNVIRLVEDQKEISSCKAYRKKYENLTDLTNAAKKSEALNGAVIYAKEVKIFKTCQLEKVVEWAKNCKLINYRFHG